MSDYIIKGMAKENQIRFFAGYTRDLVEKAREIHNTSPVCTAALGRLLTAGALMGSMCKNDSDVLTLQIQCDGPAGGLTVTADSKANVKGIINNPAVLLPANEKGKLDVAGALGHGYLNVIKDIGLKEPYVGQTDLVSGEIAEDLTYYFASSEQIPTSVGLGVLMERNNTVKHAGGFIVQLMPFADEDTITALETNLGKISSLTSLFDQGMTIQDVMQLLFQGMDVEITETLPTAYHCNCSRERVKKALISLGKKEIQSIIADGKPAVLNCHFCNTDYSFSIEELKEIIAE